MKTVTSTSLLSFSIAVFGMLSTTVAADNVPNFSVERNCRGVSGIVQTKEACIADEQSARDQLAQQWTQFQRSDTAHCTAETNSDGTPSYVELLTCLQLTSDARKLPKKDVDFGPYPTIGR